MHCQEVQCIKLQNEKRMLIKVEITYKLAEDVIEINLLQESWGILFDNLLKRLGYLDYTLSLSSYIQLNP